MSSPNPTQIPAPKPITDISQRGAAIARIVDRLPPGHYTMSLVKADNGKLSGMLTQQQGAEVKVVRTIDLNY